MKTLIMISTFCIAAAAAFGKGMPTNKLDRVKYTPGELNRLRAESHERMLKRTGGKIMRPNVGKGQLTLFNCQKRLAPDKIETAAHALANYLRVKLSVKIGDSSVDASTAADLRIKSGSQLAVFVIDDSKVKNALLTAPDEAWAIVNIAALAKDNPDEKFLTARTNKEIMRGFLFAGNGADSQSSGSLMATMLKPADLDQIPSYRPPVDVAARMVKGMEKLGLERWEMATYREACQEGWAPTPTNEFQKAIWNQVHSVPKNPIKIEP